jgi:hypothetical protein
VKKHTYLLSALLILGSFGCGGSGTTAITDSPFEGSWSGAFTIPANSNVGTASVSIDETGAVTGTARNTTTSSNFTITANIANSGAITGTLGGSFIGSITGNWSISPVNGHLVGSIFQDFSGTMVESRFDLILNSGT